ncbi:hypothetical protein MSKOL_0703 [Methanosarcina sp. Kolksee]|nr:hypothetical protein MSKOL_0703 [Methanosarcina sp. Kolksee]
MKNFKYEKDHFFKKALRRAPSKLLLYLQKLRAFNFAFLILFLTNVYGGDLSRPPAGKIYFFNMAAMNKL